MKKLLLSLFMIFSFFWSQSQNYYSVTLVQPPTLVTNAGSDISTCFYDSVQIGSVNLATGGQPPYSYSWFPTYGLSDPTIPNPIALPDDTTTYTITVTDSNHCTSFSQMTVFIDPCAGVNTITNKFEFSVYPNPNSGSVFNILINGKRLYTDYEIIVYSIYGKEIFKQQITADDKEWNGTIDIGSNVNKGIFILEIRNKHIKNYQKIIIQ